MAAGDEVQRMSVEMPFTKAATALLAGFGVSSWSDFAAFMAALYTLMLVIEWLWKHCIRPVAESRGWIARKVRKTDTDPYDDD